MAKENKQKSFLERMGESQVWKSIIRSGVPKTRRQISDKKIRLPEFSPNSKYISYIYRNNIYIYNIADAETKKITTKFNFSKSPKWGPPVP